MIRYLLMFKGMGKDKIGIQSFLKGMGKDKIGIKSFLKGMGKDRLVYKAFLREWGREWGKITDNGNKTEPKGIKSFSNKIKKREEEVFQQKLYCHLEENRAAKEGGE